MNILSVDTSTSILSIALRTDTSYEERMVNGNFSPSENLMGEIKSLLSRSGLKLNDLNLLVCTKGPGSFTGLRIAMAMLKGINLSVDAPLVSVPTLTAVERTVEKLWKGPVLSILDAKKKKYYYRLTEDGKTLIPDRDETVENIVEEVKKISSSVLLTGPDAEAFYRKAVAVDDKINLVLDPDTPRNLSRALIELGEEIYREKGADDIGEGPVYIRRSDAEEMLERKTREARGGN
jgi:tRNA threonylcarbamoyladenosine biosynthesis protein TsaB